MEYIYNLEDWLDEMQRLKKLYGFSYADIADRYGGQRDFIWKVLTGKKPHVEFETVLRITDAMNKVLTIE